MEVTQVPKKNPRHRKKKPTIDATNPPGAPSDAVIHKHNLSTLTPDNGDDQGHVKKPRSRKKKVVIKAENNTVNATKNVSVIERNASVGQHRSQFSDVKFSSLDLCDASKRALAQVLKYEFMTKVQHATLPVIMKGADVLAKAKTGTGKTTAFLLPIVEHIAREKAKGSSNEKVISAVVLSPTRELTLQIAAEVKDLTTFLSINTVSLIGGTNIKSDIKKMNGVVDIIVATPGRFQDHLTNDFSNIIKRLQGMSFLCLDEADRLLDMGFRKELARIISVMPKNRQTLLFSATMPASVKDITKVALKPNFELVDTVDENEEDTNIQVTQEYAIVPLGSQIASLEAILVAHQAANATSGYKIIVFFNTARTAGFMSELFKKLDFPILEMHSRKSQSYRTKCAKDFTAQSNVIMFSSDVSARGVDYPGVTLVVQVGLTEKEQYIHRLGRTARAGRTGQGVILLGEFEHFFLKKELKDLEIGCFDLSAMNAQGSTSRCMTLLRNLEKDKALTKSAEMAYQSFLGYYNSNLRRMNMNKIELVRMANEYSASIGLREVPALEAKTVGKMGLKGTPGLVISKNARR